MRVLYYLTSRLSELHIGVYLILDDSSTDYHKGLRKLKNYSSE